VQKAALVETQQPASVSASFNQNPPSESLMTSFSKSLYLVVNKEVEQQFLGRGVTLRNLFSCF
jgi:hypothetical protein